ncbi:hypothetical protein BEN47_18025 [Hymenobacter lapidarius]|uniref:Uncharacterized protein n=1 Tax=Hymenobacter lapidarius TaxID=1908237 RepID=A0A1G1SWB5_9BACT|nr:hypothetical protein BEN47_18025 [Hymenobacter lapidarius]
MRDKKLVDRAGQFGEKPSEDDADDEDFPIADAEHAPEPEETDEDFMKRSSREAKRKKAALDPGAAAAETRADLPAEE